MQKVLRSRNLRIRIEGEEFFYGHIVGGEDSHQTFDGHVLPFLHAPVLLSGYVVIEGKGLVGGVPLPLSEHHEPVGNLL